jgi:hypothetical protein
MNLYTMTSFLAAVKPAQARIQQLEGILLQQLQDTSRETLQQAEATGLSAKLDALLASDLLAAATAVQPPDCGSNGGSSVPLEELAGGNNQVCACGGGEGGGKRIAAIHGPC